MRINRPYLANSWKAILSLNKECVIVSKYKVSVFLLVATMMAGEPFLGYLSPMISQAAATSKSKKKIVKKKKVVWHKGFPKALKNNDFYTSFNVSGRNYAYIKFKSTTFSIGTKEGGAYHIVKAKYSKDKGNYTIKGTFSGTKVAARFQLKKLTPDSFVSSKGNHKYFKDTQSKYCHTTNSMTGTNA